MIGYTEKPTAWGLTREMARVLGVKLTDAAIDGWLSRDELGSLVDRCAACDQKAACAAWLSQASALPCVPVFCPNASALEVLSITH
jgi:hypothetical protein